MKIHYWTYEYDGEVFEHEFATKGFLKIAIDKWYAEKCEDEVEGMHNGDTFKDEVYLISFCYHPETGDRVIDEREKYAVEYECYHGDMAEHGILNRGAGGVL